MTRFPPADLLAARTLCDIARELEAARQVAEAHAHLARVLDESCEEQARRRRARAKAAEAQAVRVRGAVRRPILSRCG